MITNLNSNLFRPNIIHIILKFGQVYKWFKTMVGIQKNHPLIRKKYIKLSINQTSQLELIYAKEKYHAQMNKMVVWCCSCLASRGSNLAHRWFDIYIHTYNLPFGLWLDASVSFDFEEFKNHDLRGNFLEKTQFQGVSLMWCDLSLITLQQCMELAVSNCTTYYGSTRWIDGTFLCYVAR